MLAPVVEVHDELAVRGAAAVERERRLDGGVQVTVVGRLEVHGDREAAALVADPDERGVVVLGRPTVVRRGTAAISIPAADAFGAVLVTTPRISVVPGSKGESGRLESQTIWRRLPASGWNATRNGPL